jgi:hypothetical protein
MLLTMSCNVLWLKSSPYAIEKANGRLAKSCKIPIWETANIHRIAFVPISGYFTLQQQCSPHSISRTLCQIPARRGRRKNLFSRNEYLIQLESYSTGATHARFNALRKARSD